MSLTDYMSTELEPWKRKRFGDEIPLVRVLANLESRDEALVYVQPPSVGGRWTLCDSKTATPVVLCHAGVISWCSDVQTGNFVPLGQTNESIPSSRVQNSVSRMCEISIAIDTTLDKSMYTGGETLEKVAMAHSHFNVRNVVRRTWQNAASMNEYNRFILPSMLFVKYPNGIQAPEVPYEISPIIEQAISDAPNWYANPDRVIFFSYDDGTLRNLHESDEPTIKQGDIVWFSFALQFTVGTQNWGPDYRLVEVVRVGRIPDAFAHGPRYSAFESIDPNIRRPLRAGKAVPKSDDDSDDGNELSDKDSEDTPRLTNGKDNTDEEETIGSSLSYDFEDDMIVPDEYEDDDSNRTISLRSPSQVESQEADMAPLQLDGVIGLQNRQSNQRPSSKLFAKHEDNLSQGSRMIQGISMSQGRNLGRGPDESHLERRTNTDEVQGAHAENMTAARVARLPPKKAPRPTPDAKEKRLEAIKVALASVSMPSSNETPETRKVQTVNVQRAVEAGPSKVEPASKKRRVMPTPATASSSKSAASSVVQSETSKRGGRVRIPSAKALAAGKSDMAVAGNGKGKGKAE